MKVIIIGKDDMLANLIRGAILANVEIAGVLRYENIYNSKFCLLFRDFFNSSPALTLIKKNKLNDLKISSANSEDFKNEIIKLNADVLLVGTWAEKIKKEILNTPKIASINVHPSLLPQYRGPNPYLQTIWHGEKFSGITFHLMTDKLDAGGILAQDKIEILDGDTGKELRNKTIFRARLLCARLLEKLKQGYIEPTIQDENFATYYPDIKPEDMTLDFSKETSEQIYIQI
jgi:methionyl-tRNA formyltransferase